MNFRIEEALLYPFRNWIACMLIPGVVVYVDIILVLGLVILLVLLAAFLAFGLGGASSVTDMLPSLQELSPRRVIEHTAQSLGQLNLGELLQTDSDEGYRPRGGGGGSGGLGQQWNGPLYLIFWMGFQWQLFAQWQKHGYSASPPDFETHFLGWLKDGLKGGLFYIPLNIILFLPLVILMVVLFASTFGFPPEGRPSDAALLGFMLWGGGAVILYGLIGFFISPFLIAPMIHSAGNRSLRELCNIGKAIEITRPCYWNVIVSFLLILALWFVYFIGSFILLLVTCCIGVFLFPFIWEGAFRTSAAHLIAQAFDYQPAAAEPAAGGISPPDEGGPGSTDPKGVRRRY